MLLWVDESFDKILKSFSIYIYINMIIYIYIYIPDKWYLFLSSTPHLLINILSIGLYNGSKYLYL